jgi:subtilisin family serine protease
MPPEPEVPASELPAKQEPFPQQPTVNPPPILRSPAAPASLAHARGWMPLSSTGVREFLAAHPTWDGRGVLIGILDSGLDAGVPGFDSTTTGRSKVLDLRDFSGEGRIALSAITPRGDTVELGGRRLTGFGRMRGLVGAGPWFGGVIRERALGDPPASDINDNGLDTDTLALVVGRASDGWVLLADTDGDGSLDDERPVHDYLVAKETFGWHRGGEPPPVTIAANFSDGARGPSLDLFFDTDAHGTHIAGIAAARGIGGVAGFNGVAPGAQLIGLKISRNSFGAITTTGSVVSAVDYAIRFAATRRLPLVLNMSFGVGNEREGAARLDVLLDSILRAHPEVVFVTSAGNDGPGLSTMGFPGSARRVITVGATQPSELASAGAGAAGGTLLFFSSRGGELAKPDVVAPGVAYSTVPRWSMGDEFKGGTSMASPHVAGLAALLLSGALQEHRDVNAEDIRLALTASAHSLVEATPLDQGAGEPGLEAAWRILRAALPAASFEVEALDRPGGTAGFTVAPGPGDSVVRFRITRRLAGEPVELALTSNAPWLQAPRAVRIEGASATVTLVQHPPAGLRGVLVGTVRGKVAGLAAPVVTLVSTLVIPEVDHAAPVRVSAQLSTGAVKRVVFPADSGRPFRVRLATASIREKIIGALHQPGGAPILGDNGIPGGPDTLAAVYDIDGRDARAGFYEAVAVAQAGAATATISIDPAPIGLRIGLSGDTLLAMVNAVADSTVSGRLRIGLFGVERRFELGGTGGEDVVMPLPIPGWAQRLVVDLELDPALWPRFTDFGFTVLDSAGRILGKNPVNYAHARLSVTLPPRGADSEGSLVLAPGFAEPGSRERWNGRVTIRFEGPRPMAVESVEGDEFRASRAVSFRFHARLGALPWPVPDGYVPLGLFVGESGGITWSWELPLHPAASKP